MTLLHRAFQAVFSVLLISFAVSLLASTNFTGLISLIFGIILAISLFIKYRQNNQFKDKLEQLLTNSRFLKLAIIVDLTINFLLLLYVGMNFQINDVSDPLNVQIKATELLQNNFNWHTDEEYFYFYPNTVFFTIFLSRIMKLGMFFHVSIGMALRVFNIMLLFGLSVFSLATIWTLTKKLRNVFWGSVLLAVFPVMYLYPNLVKYTDTLTMFLTTVVVYLIAKVFTTNSKKQIITSSFLIVLLYAILFLTKSNLIILIPAVLAVLIIALVRHSRLMLKSLLVLIMLMLGLGTAASIQKPVEQHYGFDYSAKSQMGLPVTHWINMGLNTAPLNPKGAYALADDNFARQSKMDNHTEYLTDSIKSRIKTLGVTGLFIQITDKTKTLLGDSLFGYGKYQSGFSKVPRHFIQNESRYHMFLKLLSSFLIILIIIKYLIILFKDNVFEEIPENTKLFFYLIGIASIGLVLFHTVVWEVEPRYFLPLLYPFLVANYLLPSTTTDIDYDIKVSGTFITVLSFLIIGVSGLTIMANKVPAMTSGNVEHQARIKIIESVPLTNTMSFKLPVEHDSDTVKVNFPVNEKIKVQTSDKRLFANENGKYVLHGEFQKGQSIKVNISTVDKENKDEMILLYKQPPLYKKLFHGSSIRLNNQDYYLPYEIDYNY